MGEEEKQDSELRIADIGSKTGKAQELEPIEKLNLADMGSKAGEAKELHPKDRVRLTVAVSVLSLMVLIIVLAGMVMIYGPDDRIEQGKSVFEFAKTFVPPIITLIIGFYFRDNENA